jgi:hypothetical protein
MTADNIETIDLMVKPHQLAAIVRRAHAIGERKENQVGIGNYPREWQDMIVAALETFDAAQSEIERLRAALKPFAKYEMVMVGMSDTVIRRDYVDCAWIAGFDGPNQPEFRHFKDARTVYSAPSTQDKPLSVCSRCEGGDYEGTEDDLVSSTEGK